MNPILYSILIVSDSASFNTAIKALLPDTLYSTITYTSTIADAEACYAHRRYDFVIINMSLPNAAGIRWAIALSQSFHTIVLITAAASWQDELQKSLLPHGVFILTGPFSKSTIITALYWMQSALKRLQLLKKQLADLQLLHQAKLQLICHTHMDEALAHRYIIKQAMDRCVPKQVIAEEIIRLYAG